MITPSLQGGHEVCQPVAVAGAEPGDAIAIRVKDIEVTSIATASGNDWSPDGSYNGDPYCAAVCPSCGTEYPETRLEGVGQESVRCENCGATLTAGEKQRILDEGATAALCTTCAAELAPLAEQDEAEADF